MINKKLLVAVSVAATIIASSAFAKTEGNYVGINIVNSNVDHQYNDGSTKFDEKRVGYGADYKYAISVADGFFVAPGAFFEVNNVRAVDTDGDSVKNDYRYGLKADIGHDVTDALAIYFTNGVSANHYEIRQSGLANKSSTEFGYFYGAGFSLNLTQEVALNVEYNTQKVRFDTSASATDLDSDLSVFKVGATYRF